MWGIGNALRNTQYAQSDTVTSWHDCFVAWAICNKGVSGTCPTTGSCSVPDASSVIPAADYWTYLSGVRGRGRELCSWAGGWGGSQIFWFGYLQCLAGLYCVLPVSGQGCVLGGGGGGLGFAVSWLCPPVPQ